MSVLSSQVERESDVFAAPASRWPLSWRSFTERTAQVARGGGDKAIERHRSRGKLPARERVDRLLDPGSAFLELEPSPWELYEGQAPSAGMVTGIGVVEGQECVIVANDATVKGGTYFPLTVKKHLRAQEVAEQNHLPCIYLVDSGGEFPPTPGRGLPRPRPLRAHLLQPGPHVRQGIPQIAAVMGSCTAGGAYVPAMSDETIIVKGTRHDLHRRPAAREGCDGTRRDGRGAGRRRRRPPLGRRRPLRGERRACARDRPLGRSQPPPSQGAALGHLGGRRPTVDPAELCRLIPEDFVADVRHPRTSPASSAAAASTSSRSCTERRSSAASPGSRAYRSGSSHQTASSSPSPPRRAPLPRARL